MPVSYTKYLSDCYGEYFYSSPCLIFFSSVNMQHFSTISCPKVTQ